MSMIGTRVVRKEDPALLTEAEGTSPRRPTDALHAVFVRSVMAHGVIESIDTSEAQTMPGWLPSTPLRISAFHRAPGNPMLNQGMTRTWLATDRVRYVGEPYAVVLAETLPSRRRRRDDLGRYRTPRRRRDNPGRDGRRHSALPGPRHEPLVPDAVTSKVT